jgi:hypothetical protein
MQAQQQLSSISIDLTRLHRRTVTSFYSNLVTRPTGRAVRLGLEQQLVEFSRTGGPCLSILDFAQVRILDYSCADEIVAKLLMRYVEGDRPVDAYFLARGLHEHHLESLEAVLDRHRLLLAAQTSDGEARLLGPSTPVERTCWSFLVRRGRGSVREMVGGVGPGAEDVSRCLARLVATRVAVSLPDDVICPVTGLGDG